MSNIPASDTPVSDMPTLDTSIPDVSNVPNIPNTPLEVCPSCFRELTGAIEVSEGRLCGVTFVVMRETSDRNWITCDGCSQTICKSCCVVPDSGYCDTCFIKYKIEPRLP